MTLPKSGRSFQWILAVMIATALIFCSPAATNSSVKNYFTYDTDIATGVDQGTISPTPVTTDNDLVNMLSAAGMSLGAFGFISPFRRRQVMVRRRNGSGRPYTVPAEVATDNAGGAKVVQRRFQNNLRTKRKLVRITLTATANATPIILDTDGLNGRTVANVTIGGSNGVNTETGLRSRVGRAPFTLGRVWVGVSVATMWNTIALTLLKCDINGNTSATPIDAFFIQDPKNTNTLLNVTEPFDLLLDGSMAIRASLLNGEVLSLGFEVPEEVNTWAMSQAV